MREIRTSGSMSGDGKRSVAAWPKLPRPSSTLPRLPKPMRPACPQLAEADIRLECYSRFDPFETCAPQKCCCAGSLLSPFR
jgi:hypothetical protein